MSKSVKRYTASELSSMTYQQLKSMNNKEFRRAVSDITSVARRRVDNLTKSGWVNTPALTNLEERGGLSPIRNITDEKSLFKEFYKAREFLRTETSTKTGVKRFSEKVSSSLGIPNMSYDELTKFFDIYNSVTKANPNLGLDYQNTFKGVYDSMRSGKSTEDITSYLVNRDIEQYESGEYDDDEFFDMG